MATDMGRGITAPESNDDIEDGATEMRALAASTAAALNTLEATTNQAISDLASTTANAIDDAKWSRGLVPVGANLDEWRGHEYEGAWYIFNPAEITGIPNALTRGNLIINAGPPGYSYTTQTFVQAGENNLTLTRTMTGANSWSPWETQMASGRLIPEGTDLNTWYGYAYAGAWYVTGRAHAESINGMPFDGPGNLFVISGHPGYSYTTHLFFTAGGRDDQAVYWRSLAGSSRWHPWTVIGGPGGDPFEPTAVGMKNRDLLDLLIARKGGTIGTGGKAAFALRLDHGTVAFRDHVSALLKKYGLPATMAVYSEQREIKPEENGVEWSVVESWHRTHGMTFGNHSDDHLDKPDASGWYGGTIGSQETLKTLMPSVPVEQYIPHGSVGYERYGGFNRATSHEEIVGTVAGRMALSSHALVSGYRGSTFRALTGQPMQGLRHWTIENSTVAEFKTMLDRAIAHKSGFAVMFHPEFVGLGDRMTWADIDACLAYVAEKRDAGDLITLTLDGLALADIRTDYRDDLVSNPDSSATSHTLDMSRRNHYRGGSRIGQWHVTTSGPAEVILRAAPTDNAWEATRTVTLDAAGDHIIYLPFGIPLDYTGNVTLSIAPISGTVQVTETHAYAS